MRPPALRTFRGAVEQIRPTFGGPLGPSPAPKKVYASAENTDSPMQRAVQRNHELNVRPLREVNDYRGHTALGWTRSAPRPLRLVNPTPTDKVLVYAFE